MINVQYFFTRQRVTSIGSQTAVLRLPKYVLQCDNSIGLPCKSCPKILLVGISLRCVAGFQYAPFCTFMVPHQYLSGHRTSSSREHHHFTMEMYTAGINLFICSTEKFYQASLFEISDFQNDSIFTFSKNSNGAQFMASSHTVV